MFIIKMPGQSYHGPLSFLTPREIELREHLMQHIYYLAGKIKERNMWHYRHLQLSEQYIETVFKQYGYQTTQQEYLVKQLPVRNIIAEYKGTSQPDEIIIIGAHYDSVVGSPGADDNASGVAAMLELARLMTTVQLKRTIRFVGFVNEECPFFYTKNMGSFRYAQAAKTKNENIVAMLSLESIGYYSNNTCSQYYPFPFRFFYPTIGDFIGFVGNLTSRHLVRHVITLFRQHTHFPSEGVAAPSWMIGVGWSDQWFFWKYGYQAVMVTNTALFRNPHYHTEHDTPETIDYARTARVVNGLANVIQDLAGLV